MGRRSKFEPLVPDGLSPEDRARYIEMLKNKEKKAKMLKEKMEKLEEETLVPELRPYKNNMSKGFKDILLGKNDAYFTTNKDPQWKDKFLDAMRNTGNIRLSCLAAGVSRAVAMREKEADPEFSEMWDLAFEDATDILEGTAFKRAKEGSDYLLTFMLRSLRPKVYGEKKTTVEDTVKGLALLELMRNSLSTNGFVRKEFVDAEVDYDNKDVVALPSPDVVTTDASGDDTLATDGPQLPEEAQDLGF